MCSKREEIIEFLSALAAQNDSKGIESVCGIHEISKLLVRRVLIA